MSEIAQRPPSPRIRVLFPFAGGPLLGGSHISAMSLATALDPEQFDVKVLIHLEPGAVGAHAKDLGLTFEILKDVPLMSAVRPRRPGHAGPFSYVVNTLPALRTALRRIGPDIVHTNEGVMHANWALPSKLSGCRHVWHHRQDPRAKGTNLLAPLLADQIVSVSHFAKPARPIQSIDQKFSVIRSPFEFPAQRPDHTENHRALCTELNLPPDAVLLGYFGSLVPRKRPDHFIDAVAAIRAALPGRSVHGLLFGDIKPEAAQLFEDCKRKVAALGVEQNIHFMGFRKPIAPAMAGVDVKMVTALNEPFGRTLIEAMYLGTPVVATDHGGNPEAIRDGDTGFLVDPHAADSFVKPVLALLGDPELRARIGENAHKDAAENYSRAHHVAQISQLYRRCFTDKRDPTDRGPDDAVQQVA